MYEVSSRLVGDGGTCGVVFKLWEQASQFIPSYSPQDLLEECRAFKGQAKLQHSFVTYKIWGENVSSGMRYGCECNVLYDGGIWLRRKS